MKKLDVNRLRGMHNNTADNIFEYLIQSRYSYMDYL